MNHPGCPNREAIQSAQLSQLRRLIDACLSGNPFYAERIKKAGLDANLKTLEEFTARMGFTTKEQLVQDQADHPPYGTNLTFPLKDYTRFSQTSATTGNPLRWLDTTKSWNGMINGWKQVLKVSGVKKADRILFPFSFGPFIGFWLAFEAAAQMECLCIPGGGLSSLARLRVIVDNKINVLCCTPTYAIRLAQAAEEEKIDLNQTSVKILIVAGEPGGSIPATRSRIESLWPGARVMDHHGMTEVGPVSYQCPHRRRVLHVIESDFLTEVLDPQTQKPIQPGEKGELVLTTLGRTASPVLRYRTGDIVRLANAVPCECGRYDMALEGGILARTDDMIVVRGVNLYPAAIEDVVRSIDAVAEYRVEIQTARSMTELNIKIEPAGDLPNGHKLTEQLQAKLKSAFALRIPVTLVPAGTLPRFEMKAKRWIRL
ncbi:MAG: AMP-binding protein [Planctomycetes bacterium]|nr:AMP-binding protein [Planctomycetota bacterium]